MQQLDLLWMDAMLDFICMGFAELWGTGTKQKCQTKNVCSGIRTINHLPRKLDHWATLTDELFKSIFIPLLT